jgi:hypothetical protein
MHFIATVPSSHRLSVRFRIKVGTSKQASAGRLAQVNHDIFPKHFSVPSTIIKEQNSRLVSSHNLLVTWSRCELVFNFAVPRG